MVSIRGGRQRRREKRQRRADLRADVLDRGLDVIEHETTTQQNWLDGLTDMLADPTVVDIAAVPDPADLAPGAVPSRQTLYADPSRCSIPGCGAPTLADVCSHCMAKGRTAPEVDPITYDLPWLPPIEPPDWDDDAVRKLVVAIFFCDAPDCGERLGSDGLCPVGGRTHATYEHLAALESWGSPDADA